MAHDGSNPREFDARDAVAMTDFLSGGNAGYLAEQHARWASDPTSVDPELRAWFEEMGGDGAAENAAGPSWARRDWPTRPGDELTAALSGDWSGVEGAFEKKVEARTPQLAPADVQAAVRDSVRALMLIRAYRIRGHLIADLDPLEMRKVDVHPELDPATYGFTESDWEREIFLDHVLGLETANLKTIMEILQRTYCGTFAIEFMHISDPAQKLWLQQRIEGMDKEIKFTTEGKHAILQKLLEAEGFENFLQTKYQGTKRFGLDGGESMVPALEQIIKRGGALGVEEISIGMPHRGRLNVLAAVMGKPYHQIFHEFQGGAAIPSDVGGSGDVKYHLGASSDREFDGNKVHLSLAANPSHLEAVDPVVLGKCRAKQDLNPPKDPLPVSRTHVLPLLLHGDAAFAGQGVIAECFGFTGLKGYRTGGTIHFIVNNQIGFTTSPRFARSSPYPSDVAKMVEAPILHVNGDDPEAVVYAAKVATEFRMEFGHDVVIDMWCYRRYGHNEGDEPSFTQPLMYKKIRARESTRAIYARRLVEEGLVGEADVQSRMDEFKGFLTAEFDAGEAYEPKKADWLDAQWKGFRPPADDDRKGDTAVPLERLKSVGERLTYVPEKLTIHRTLDRILKAKASALEAGEGIDWATGEALAFGTLLEEGYRVRLSGQDSVRGTFSQRHASFVDQETERRWTPLRHLSDGQAEFEVIDSNLSEFAVMGFEYGYSLADPCTLTLWEAQFGDFANGAQVIFDQFISSAERKWLRMSGLVLLLPHGYEGQGPEHSSARLERYLQACAQDNIQVANCTTPANYFHILRRQMKRDFRKPLVLMTPKSLLRHKRAVSTFDEMGPGSSFHRVLWDDAQYRPGSTVELVPDNVMRRVVLCSGKVYYDLLEEREARGINDVYLLRVEQFYPYPAKSLAAELRRFGDAEMVWCQEEPKNMGGWTFMQPNLEWTLDQIGAKHTRPRYAGRPASASTATGHAKQHREELAAFLEDALG
ncbi:2-oxoglutarate dehydrogenase E1 component [Parvularcula dongshanensis]|uniref:2-oxoglutarate dehydrogenase E1 component n=1 Tax=Parvularcula dongshanensis TaxID=1173995 RepID=A0A840I521_9PROT|nr:2-oxoglutarate dehydrogenase E1 component [Parvularcula dongshanensis]MBB4659268.1 2-oxoglutarate dehydrogenase E1 component [Parvularcula dongshanensis]